MFKCDKCGKVTKPGEKMNKVVVSTREKVYTEVIREAVYDAKGNIRIPEELHTVGKGTEIEKEISVCDKCYKGE